MKPKKSARVSVRDIAEASGISKTIVGYVLQNRPGPSTKTRERVLRTAKRLGYVPDARIASWMATVRGAKSKDLLPIAWLNAEREIDAWHKYQYLSPYFEGARARALELGYRLEEIWGRQEAMTQRRISQILRQTGTEGVIIAPPVKHVRFDWTHLAGVSLEGTLLAPSLHRVTAHAPFNLLLALKMVRRFGYRRIGICMAEEVDRASQHAIRSALYFFQSTLPEKERCEPFFYLTAPTEKQLRSWLHRHQPDAVIGLDSHLVQWMEAAGRRVPQEVGVIHLATDDDVSDWAGICGNRRQMGAAAAELVISLVQNRQFGIPKTQMEILIRGTWHSGSTLLIPKPK